MEKVVEPWPLVGGVLFCEVSWPPDAVFDALGKVKLKPYDDVTGAPYSELECVCFGTRQSPKSTR